MEYMHGRKEREESFYALFGKMPIRELHIIVKFLPLNVFIFNVLPTRTSLVLLFNGMPRASILHSQTHMHRMKKLSDRKDAACQTLRSPFAFHRSPNEREWYGGAAAVLAEQDIRHQEMSTNEISRSACDQKEKKSTYSSSMRDQLVK